jgi:hypothetical protein
MRARPPSDSLLTRERSPLRTCSGESGRVRCDGLRPTDTRHLLSEVERRARRGLAGAYYGPVETNSTVNAMPPGSRSSSPPSSDACSSTAPRLDDRVRHRPASTRSTISAKMPAYSFRPHSRSCQVVRVARTNLVSLESASSAVRDRYPLPMLAWGRRDSRTAPRRFGRARHVANQLGRRACQLPAGSGDRPRADQLNLGMPIDHHHDGTSWHLLARPAPRHHSPYRRHGQSHRRGHRRRDRGGAEAWSRRRPGGRLAVRAGQ